jgi:hypothetical protein
MVAFDFPTAPAVNDTYTAGGVTYVWNGQGWAVQPSVTHGLHTVSDDPPVGPSQGDLWFEADIGIFWIWYDDGNTAQWVQVNGYSSSDATGGGGLDQATADNLYVNLTGDTMSGPLIVTPKGSMFGNAAGPSSALPMAQADANIRLYDAGPDNWAGIGADTAGSMWFRVGTATGLSPAFYLNSQNRSGNFAAGLNTKIPFVVGNATDTISTTFDASGSGTFECTSRQFNSILKSGGSGYFWIVNDTGKLGGTNQKTIGSLSAAGDFGGIRSVSATGNVVIGGTFSTYKNGNQFGNADGASAGGGVSTTDANILLYGGGNNWAGIGSDPSGHMWFRVGNIGFAAPAMWLRAQDYMPILPNGLRVRDDFGLWNTFNSDGMTSIRFTGGSSWGVDGYTGTMRWMYGASSIMVLVAGSWDMHWSGAAYKPGGGPWGVESDARIKTVTGDYTRGLEAIKQLSPVKYVYKANEVSVQPAKPRDTPHTIGTPNPDSRHYQVALSGTEYIGLVAQDAEIPMPEMVTQHAASIDGTNVTDLRMMDTNALTYALINAVKELSAQNEEMAARLAALEGARR